LTTISLVGLRLAKVNDQRLVWGVWEHKEEAISAEITDWRGGEVELEVVAEDFWF
jgi:hypothetical protein